jgi:hypothetical protein
MAAFPQRISVVAGHPGEDAACHPPVAGAL